MTLGETSNSRAERTLAEDPDGLPPAVVAAYVARCVAALPALKLALERCDYDHMRIFGHRLKGTGAAYGLPMLSKIGSVIEELAAAEEDAGEIRRQVAALEAYITSEAIRGSG